MATTTTGPWRNWRKRGRSQRGLAPRASPPGVRIHLSTALAVVLMAAMLVGLNLNIEQGRHCGLGPRYCESGQTYGFPLPWIDVGSATHFLEDGGQGPIGHEEWHRIDWPLALANAAILLACVTALAWLLERRIRRQAGA